jgi:hypothetical protein
VGIRHANLCLLRRLRPSDLEKNGFHPRNAVPGRFGGIDKHMREHQPNHVAEIEHYQAAVSIAPLYKLS